MSTATATAPTPTKRTAWEDIPQPLRRLGLTPEDVRRIAAANPPRQQQEQILYCVTEEEKAAAAEIVGRFILRAGEPVPTSTICGRYGLSGISVGALVTRFNKTHNQLIQRKKYVGGGTVYCV